MLSYLTDLLQTHTHIYSHTGLMYILMVGGLRWDMLVDGRSFYMREILENNVLTVQQSVNYSEILPKKQIVGMPITV